MSLTPILRPDGSRILPPTTLRRMWVPGIVYTGETPEQAAAREAQCRAEDASADAELQRLLAARLRPWWE